jgi:hypothetical protein
MLFVEYNYNSNADLQVLNLQGKVMLADNIDAAKKKSIVVSGFPKGIYVVQLKTDAGIQTEKLFIY